MSNAYNILNDPFKNKGTAFTKKEREELNLIGLLPPTIQTIDEQAREAYQQYLKKDSSLAKRRFLMQVFNTNRTLFYYLFSQHIEEFNPIVYDPEIAVAIKNYSHLFLDSQYAVYLDVEHPENIEASLKNATTDRNIRLIVVTDAEEILGIGDWGTNGVGISVGKLMIYTAAAGIDPATVIPIVIDAGTNRQELLDDPLYLGAHHKRIRGKQYDDFIKQFVNTSFKLFPKLYLHWEDFGRSNATKILNKYKDKIPTFNDDVQGTGIVALAGIFGSLALSKEKLTNQTYLCYGAGSAGAGIANRVLDEMIIEGLSKEEAYQHFYMVDKQGILFDDMSDLTDEQRPFAKKRSDFENSDNLTNLPDIVKAVKPTILVGTSTDTNAFTKEIVAEMCKTSEHPIIFPLSNPTELAEASAENLIKWSNGKAHVATGIPAGTVTYNGIDYVIGQANNSLIYPGIGLGMLASESSILSDEMINDAAHSVSDLLDKDNEGSSVLPPFSNVAQVSLKVAQAVAERAQKQGYARAKEKDMKKAIQEIIWHPEY